MHNNLKYDWLAPSQWGKKRIDSFKELVYTLNLKKQQKVFICLSALSVKEKPSKENMSK